MHKNLESISNLVLNAQDHSREIHKILITCIKEIINREMFNPRLVDAIS